MIVFIKIARKTSPFRGCRERLETLDFIKAENFNLLIFIWNFLSPHGKIHIGNPFATAFSGRGWIARTAWPSYNAASRAGHARFACEVNHAVSGQQQEPAEVSQLNGNVSLDAVGIPLL